jgi:hypothetical protein
MENRNAIRAYAQKVGLPEREAVAHAVRVGGGVTGGAAQIGRTRVNLHDYMRRHKIVVDVTRTVGTPDAKEGVA